MKTRKRVFETIMNYCDIHEILMLIKIKDFEKYNKILKKALKEKLYKGLSTKERMDYWTVIAKLDEVKKNNKSLYKELIKKKSNYEMEMSLDIDRTYSSLDFFKYEQKGHKQLLRILRAVSQIFPNVGYCQGMNFFSAIILLILGNEEVLSYNIIEYILDGSVFIE